MAQKNLLKNKNYKRCSKCGKVKLLNLFYKNKTRTGGYSYECKSCSNDRIKKYRKSGKNNIREKELERHKLYYERYKIKLRDDKFLRDYGITYAEKLSMIEDQQNKCKICGKEINKITGCLDHCHKTKKVRGILCRNCNMAIGIFQDNISTLKKAIKYLS